MPHLASSSRLNLEPLSPTKHLADFHAIWSNPHTITYLPSRAKNTTSLEEAHDMLLSQLASPEQPEIDKFAVLLKPRASQSASSGVEEEECRDDEKMICVVGTNRTSPQGMEVGYVLNEEYWGQGYGSEMFEMFLKYYWTIPERKHINLLVAKIGRDNVPSQRVAQRVKARKGRDYMMLDGKEVWMNCWYLDREGWEVQNLKEYEERIAGDAEAY